MICKITLCSEFPNIPEKAGRVTRRRRGTQAIAKRFAFHANAIIAASVYKIISSFESHLGTS